MAQWSEWRQKKIVKESDVYIIAMSSCALHSHGLFLGSDIGQDKFPLKFLAGAGFIQILLDKQTGKQAGSPHMTFLENRKKNSGSTVSTEIFYSPEYEDISAILYSYEHPLMNKEPVRSDEFFSLFNNPKAKNPLPKEFLSNVPRWHCTGTNGQDLTWEKVAV